MSIWANGTSGLPHRERGHSETTGSEKPEKGGLGHEGLTVQPDQKGEKEKQAFQNVVFLAK